MVCGVDRRDDEHVGRCLTHHLLEIDERGAIDAHDLLGIRQAARVDVAQPDERRHVGIVAGQHASPEAHAPDAGSYQRHTSYVAGALPEERSHRLAGVVQKRTTQGSACRCEKLPPVEAGK